MAYKATFKISCKSIIFEDADIPDENLFIYETTFSDLIYQ